MNTRLRYRLSPLFLSFIAAVGFGSGARAQVLQPPIHGFTGTIALPSNVDDFYSGVNDILTRTSDGIDHLTRRSGKTKVEGAASIEDLQPGTPVVVYYTVKGIAAGQPSPGTVERIDQSGKQVTIRFADGTSQTLRRKTVERAVFTTR